MYYIIKSCLFINHYQLKRERVEQLMRGQKISCFSTKIKMKWLAKRETIWRVKWTIKMWSLFESIFIFCKTKQNQNRNLFGPGTLLHNFPSCYKRKEKLLGPLCSRKHVTQVYDSKNPTILYLLLLFFIVCPWMNQLTLLSWFSYSCISFFSRVYTWEHIWGDFNYHN